MIKYLIEGIVETFESKEEAEAYIAVLGSGVSVQLISDDTDKDNKEMTTDDTILNPNFRQDAAESADVVSGPQPALDTGSASEDGSLDLPPVETFNIDGREVTKEEFDAYSKKQEEADDEIKTMDNYFSDTWTGLVASGRAALGSQARVPTFLNELAYSTVGNLFLSDEDKEMMSSLDPKIKQVILNAQANASNPLGSVAQAGLEAYEDAKIAEKELRSKMEQFDTTILEDLGQGNIIRGLQRASSSALQSAPSVAQSMIPYIGIASIAAGAAAEASAEAQEEGKDINLKTMLYAGTKGAAEGVLETVTRGIAKGMFKSLTGKSKRFIDKSVKDVVGGIMKDAGMEGGSEGMTEVINVIAENIYLGKETGVLEGVKRVGEAALVGAFMGGKMTGTGAASSVMFNTVQTNRINKKLDQSEFDSLKDSFDLETGVDQNIVDLVEIRGALGIIENKAKKEVREGEITQEEANNIVSNFKEIETATKQTKAAKIEKELQPEIVENLARKNKLIKQIKEIDDSTLSAPLKEEVDLLDTLIKKGTIASVTKKNLKNVEKVAKGFKNVEIKEVDNKEAIEIASKVSNKTKESTGYGFIYQEDGVSKIVINKDEVATDNILNTGAHEFLHFALKNIFKSANTEATYETLATSVGDLLASSELVGDTQRFNERLATYEAEFKEGGISAGQLFEEQLVVLSEAMLDGEFDIKKNPSIMSNLKDLARRLLSVIGVKAKFNSDEDVLNFIKDYNRSISKGKFTLGQKRLIKEGAKGKLITPKTTAEKVAFTKESMKNASPEMRALLMQQEEIYMQDGTVDPGTQMINEADIQDKIDELRKIERAKEPETPKKKVEKRKKEPKVPLKLTVEQATDRYNDALDAYNNDPDNPALEDRVGKALKILDEAEARVDTDEEVKPVADLPKRKREKKDKSTRRYSLEAKEKALIEIKVAKAKKLTDEVKARDKKLKQEALDKIPKDEKKLSRTKQAEARDKIEASPPRSPKPVELIRLEKEIANDLKIPLGKANTIFTKLFYDKIPAEAKEAISRDFFKASMESDMLTMVINEFKPKTVNREGEAIINDLEDIIFQRGGLRVRNLAKRLGVEQDGITKGEDALVNIATEDTDVKVNGKTIIDPLGKVKISSILASDTRYEQAMEAAIKFWKENEGNSPLENFKKLPGFTAEVMGEMFGLPAAIFDKRISRSPNLNAQQYPRAFEQITKEYGVFKVFEDGKIKEVRKDDSNGDAEAYEKELTDKGIKFERVANQSILRTFFRILPTLSNADYRYANGRPGRYQGKATGVGRNLQDFSYENIVRKTTGIGNRDADTPKKAYEELLKAIGGKMVDGKPKLVAKPKSKEAQTLLSILRLTNKMISNELSRSPQIGLDPMTVKDIAAGKNVLMESKKQQFNPDAYSNGRGIEKKMDVMFNKFLEYKTGIESFETFDASEAQKIGSRIGKLDIFIPPSAEDFVGLLYKTLPKGKRGEQMINFYKKNLLNPYAKAMTGLEMARNKIGREYKRLKEDLNIIPDDLKEQITYENENGDIIQSPFTKENAVRVYMWDQKGMEIPNLKEENKKIMLNEILENPELRLFAQELSRLNTGEDTKPKNNWAGGTITTDLMSALNNTGRKELLTVWKNNVDVIFSPKNLNKLQVAFGNKYVSALKNSLTRMETGRNRISKVDKGMEETNAWSDFLTNSVGNIMFLNSRSALLQLISATNFLNFRENNIFAAGKAFANQKQFWSDFIMLWNSDFLVDRRDGLKLNVNEADLANVAATQGMQGVIAKLLKAGFAPTKYADSIAISLGGASFYRTKYNALIKQGVKPADAKKQTMMEFTEIAQESQQSSRPDKISKEQSQPIGRYVLAFANTPQQYARIIKKAILDLKNGRGSKKENLAKIAYYGFLQNFIFSYLQQGLFAMAFDDDENEDTSKKDEAINVANSMSNSLLRGMGLYGAVVAAAKDIGLTLMERSEKKKPNYSKYIVKNLSNISPPIGSKIGKIYRGVDNFEWNAGFMFDKQGVSKGDLLKLPGVRAVGDLTSALTNVPLDRAIAKATNLIDMLQEETKDVYKPFLLLGYPEWQLEQAANDPKADERYEKEKERRKNIKKENKIKEERGDLSGDELRRYDLKKLKKEKQVDILYNKFKLTRTQINKLTKEEDRINKIMSLEALKKSKKIKESFLIGPKNK